MKIGPSLALALSPLLASIAPAQNQAIQTANGTDDYVAVPHHASLVPPSGITVEAWVFYDPSALLPGAIPTIARKNPTPLSESWNLRVNGGGLQWVVSVAAGLINTNMPGAFPALAWHHVAGTYDGLVSRLYLDGVQVAQSFTAGAIGNTGGDLRIGKGDDSNSNGETWAGEIDEVRLWPFARTAVEIQSTLGLALEDLPGLASSWHLDGNALDSTGSNHGSLVGAPAFVASSNPLQTLPFPGAVPYGASAAGCAGPIAAGLASPPQVGNAAFAFVCTQGPQNGAGLLALSAAPLAAPLVVAGVGIWIDPASPALATIPASTNALRFSRVTIPLPGSPSLVGLSVYGQFVWLDACGPQGITASDALAVALIP